MNYLNKLLEPFYNQPIDVFVVSRLYILSKKSIFAIIAFSLVLVYSLYPMLNNSIFIWLTIVIILALFRLYFVNLHEKEPTKYSLIIWHEMFVFGALSTAFLFSLIGSIGLFYLDEVRQIFVVASLIGLTAGAMSSLFPDIRIVIGYISIILIPLIVSLLFIDSSMHFILAFLVTVYFLSQIIIFFNTYKQNNELEKRKEEVHKNQLELFKKKEELDYFFEQAPVGIFSYDMDLNITDTNRAFLDLFGLNKDELVGRNLHELPDQRPLLTIKNALHTPEVYSGPYTSIKGMELWVEAKCFPVHNDTRESVGGLCLLENKTKEHNALEDINYLASHDPLTSLLNRRGMKEYVKTFMTKEEHRHMYSLLVYLDLNKFKNINDSLGHKAGDKLLIAISNRLKISIKESCVISRFGGDEFIVVSPFVSSTLAEAEKEAKLCIGRIESVFVDSFNIDNMKLFINTSLGIVVIEPNSVNIDEIIRYADIAMYQAKVGTSGHVSYYDTALDNERKKIFMLQHDLLYAAEKNELQIYLQPLVTMKDDKVVAAEALLRWEHPSLGFLSPIEFIPIAIETGQISDITWWIVEEICKYISRLKEKNSWNLNYISINVNAKQLLLKHFVDEFLEILLKYGLNSSDILIEITERSIIDNFEDTQDVINALHNEGIKCAIDDFGIGYSSLSYLKKLSFDTLKIDMEFIKDIKNRPDDLVLVKTILEIGKQFNYSIVVEGIEDKKQKELLLSIDNDLVYQGFLFSKPIPKDEFTEKYLNKKVER